MFFFCRTNYTAAKKEGKTCWQNHGNSNTKWEEKKFLWPKKRGKWVNQTNIKL